VTIVCVFAFVVVAELVVAGDDGVVGDTVGGKVHPSPTHVQP
jgi:hypothetical protein